MIFGSLEKDFAQIWPHLWSVRSKLQANVLTINPYFDPFSQSKACLWVTWAPIMFFSTLSVFIIQMNKNWAILRENL